jgi:phosphoglycolate phosphatase
LDIATNKPLRISKAILAHLKMDHYFRSIAASDSVRPPFASKGEILRHLLQIHCLVEARTWYVGDSAEDAQACAECGLPFVWAAYGYGRLGEAEAKSVFRTIRSLVELKEILR